MRISDWSSDVCSSDLIADDEADLRFGQRDLDLAGLLLEQLAHLVHRLARHDHARHAGGTVGKRDLAPREPVAVRGDGAKQRNAVAVGGMQVDAVEIIARLIGGERSEEHTSELQSLMRISY